MSTMPYIGLRPFNEDESDIFFGRDEHANELLEKIGTQYFTAVTGLSGCGKSSLIYAGIIPRIQEGYLSEAGVYWRIITMCPGNDPFDNLASALLDKREDYGYGIKKEYEALFQGTELKNDEIIKASLKRSLRNGHNLQDALSGQGVNIPEETNFLLIVDQFEEILRKNVNKEEAEQFVKFLLESSWAEYRVYVVITMRSEFIGECAKFDDLAEEINSSFFLVPRLTPAQLREAIENPIKVYRGTIDSELVNKILEDSYNEIDQLPIIQHSLMWIWNKMLDENLLPPYYIDNKQYESYGRIKNALSRHLNALYDKLSNVYNKKQQSIQQLITQYLFIRLAEVDQSSSDDIKQEAKFKEIVELILPIAKEKYGEHIQQSDIGKFLKQVINEFRNEGQRFLKPSLEKELDEESIITIAHESIIRQWDTLETWLKIEQKYCNLYISLEEDIKRWEKEQKDEDLLKGSKLEQAKEWIKNEKPTINWIKRYSENAAHYFPEIVTFIEKSKEFSEREARREHNRLLREKELAQQKIESDRLKVKFAKVSIVFTIIFFIAVIVILYATLKLLEIQQQRTRDLIDSNITQAVFQIRDNQFNTANTVLAENETLLSESDKFINPTLSSRQQVNQLLQQYSALFGQTQSINTFPDFESEIHTFIPMNEGFVLGGKGGNWGCLNPANTNPFIPYQNLKGDVKAVVFHPTLHWLITGDTAGKVTIWDNNITPIRSINIIDIGAEITALALGNNVLFAGDAQGQIHHWQITAQGLAQYQVEKVYTGRISTGGLTLNQDKTQLLMAAYEPPIKLWDTSNNQYHTKSMLKEESNKIYGITFGNHSKTVATAQADKTARLYSLDAFLPTPIQVFFGYLHKPFSKNLLLQSFFGHKDAVFTAQFANNDRYLISGSQDNQIRIWDVESGKTLQTLEGHQGTITNLLVKDNELWSAGLDGMVKQWSLKLPYHLVETCIDKTCPTDFDATLIGQPIDYRQHPISVSIAPQGQYIVVGFLDGTLRLYSLPNIELIDEVKKHRDRIRHINFNQNGDLLATAGYDGHVGIWELKDGKLSNRQFISVSDKPVYDVAFSPDSKTIATANLDGVIRLCSLETLQCEDTFDKEKTKQALFVQFINENQLVATIDEQAYSLNLDVKQYETIESAKAENALLGITHSKGYYATYGQEAQLTVYDDKFSKIFQTTAHTDTIYKAIFSPNGQQIATVSSDEKLKMWDLQAKSDDKLLFTIDLPVREKTQLKQEGNLPQVYDFDFRCTPTGCWIAAPLTHGYIAVYPFGDIYE